MSESEQPPGPWSVKDHKPRAHGAPNSRGARVKSERVESPEQQ